MGPPNGGAAQPSAPPPAPGSRPKVLIITGPTAVGKTAASLALAKHLNGEIISADSVQVYRGLDIGSDKVRRPPHFALSWLQAFFMGRQAGMCAGLTSGGPCY